MEKEKFIYRLARHHCSYERKHETLESAIQDAVGDYETGEAYPKEITTEDGKRILGHDELYREIENRLD